MNAVLHDNVMKYWETRVVKFLHENNNQLGKFDHENKELTFITNYNDIVTVSYEKLKFRMNEEAEKAAYNPWIWTELTESIKPERKAGIKVPVAYMTKGHTEWTPYSTWISKGYVKRID